MKKSYCAICGKYRISLKYHTFWKEHQFVLLFIVSVTTKNEKIFKEEDAIKILKILGLIKIKLKYMIALKIRLKKK